MSEKETVVEKTDGMGIKVYRGIYATLHSQSICLKCSLKVTVLAQSLELKSFFFFFHDHLLATASASRPHLWLVIPKVSHVCPVRGWSLAPPPALDGPLTPLHPLMLHPGGIEHFIKTGRGLGSNVTVLSRSLSIPPWPFVVFNYAGCQAWPCRRMEGTQRSRAVRVTQWQLSHKPWKSRPFSAPQQFNYYLSMLEWPSVEIKNKMTNDDVKLYKSNCFLIFDLHLLPLWR